MVTDSQASKIVKFLELFFPLFAAWAVNSTIPKQDANETTLRKKWAAAVETYDDLVIGKMADEIYTTESQRLNSITGKGSSLLATAGFAITIISLTLAIGRDRLSALAHFSSAALVVFLFFILFGEFYLLSTAFCAIKAVRIAPIHMISTLDLDVICKNKSEKSISKDWLLKKISYVELNSSTIVKKANWVEAAQTSFIRGILCVAIVYLMLLFFV